MNAPIPAALENMLNAPLRRASAKRCRIDFAITVDGVSRCRKCGRQVAESDHTRSGWRHV